YVDRHVARAAQPPNRVGLEHFQHAGLNVRCQVSDFVEQDRSPVRQLEQTLPTLVSVGDRAVFVSEQLRLEERGREPAAMHLAKGAVSTRGEVMDRAGHPAFPG